LTVLLAVGLAGCVSTAARPAPASGPRDDAWVERTLASLSLRQKVAQMVMPWVSGGYTAVDSDEFTRVRQWVERDQVGGLIFSVGLPHSYAARANELQSVATVPLLIASDMENGPGMRMSGIYSYPHLLPQGGGTAFPPLMALGAAESDSLAYALGRVMAREARAVGVHVTFGPVLDVNSNPANPIINIRSFGEDPIAVGRLGRAYIRGAREGGLLTTAKHFPGHGDTESDSHRELPVIRASRARLDSVELRPYRDAVSEGVDGIMTAHIAVSGVLGDQAPPATLSPYFMTDLLRRDMGFRGLLVTDALDMGGVINQYGDAEAAVLSVLAGADVMLMPRDVPVAIDAVVAAVQSGRIAEARIDASVRRILTAKARSGLSRARTVSLDSVVRIVGTRDHAELARTIAERSITLVRDQRAVVPLSPALRRLLVVTYTEPGDPAGALTFTAGLQRGGRVIAAARVDARTTAEELAALAARVDSVDAVIVAAVAAPLEGSGSIGPRGRFPEFVQALSRGTKPMVVVSLGSPYLLTVFPEAPAYLLAWGSVDASQEAAARALLGETSIAGRLPVSLPPFHARGEGLRRPALIARH
jgi:beta-N-acetylhexosaminidase